MNYPKPKVKDEFMIFIYDNETYFGKTAVNILRAVEENTDEYPFKNGTIQDFLSWSMRQLSDRIPLRELDVSPTLSDETLAFNYLCLLDNYQIGSFYNGEVLPNEKTR